MSNAVAVVVDTPGLERHQCDMYASSKARGCWHSQQLATGLSAPSDMTHAKREFECLGHLERVQA